LPKYVSIFSQTEYKDVKMLQSELRMPSILLLWCENKWRRRGEENLKGCGLKILMEAHSLFFPTFM
jgi:hypothetical protein